MQWIDNIIVGLIELYGCDNPYDICNCLNINIIKTCPSSFLLRGDNAIYIRDFNNKEFIFIRDDLEYKLEKFYIAHELGHAVLHPNIKNSFNKDLINLGKLEKQANYFAFKLLGIDFDFNKLEFENMNLEEIAHYLEVPYEPLYKLVN